MIVYHRNCYKPDALEATKNHVCEHISAVASETDDPDEFKDRVKIQITKNEDGSARIFGELNRDPAFDYSLPEDFEMPGQEEYRQGFGVREMTPEELQEHLIKKEGYQ